MCTPEKIPLNFALKILSSTCCTGIKKDNGKCYILFTPIFVAPSTCQMQIIPLGFPYHTLRTCRVTVTHRAHTLEANHTLDAAKDDMNTTRQGIYWDFHASIRDFLIPHRALGGPTDSTLQIREDLTTKSLTLAYNREQLQSQQPTTVEI